MSVGNDAQRLEQLKASEQYLEKQNKAMADQLK
jgi:hypothetical protein